LAHVLRHVPAPSAPDLLVGTSTGDDAAVWRVSDDRALVSTVDFFTPVVDDARTWGMIAAANSASDVYAMGGRPLFALNVAGWPRDLLSLDLLGEALQGASAVAATGGWVVVGGHTVDAPEPFLGQSVTGEVHPDKMMTNDAARPGDVLVLTKPIGTGIITTALKRSEASAAKPGGSLYESYTAAVHFMTTLNADGAQVAAKAGVRAATDITGFGLLGHLHKMALGSGVQLILDAASIPLLPGVRELADQGIVPGGTGRNIEFVAPFIDWEVSEVQWADLLADPQTSGGLVLCVKPERVAGLLAELAGSTTPGFVIGSVTEPTSGPGRIVVR
jgi:selenide, water dikinase